MPLTEQRLSELSVRCNPDEWLPPGDSRNVPIDTMGDDDSLPRGEGWANQLAQRLTRPTTAIEGDVTCFFSGLPGSGKTTELRRVADILWGKGWLPVIVDALHFIDVNQTIDLPDVLFPILYEAERAIRTARGDFAEPQDSTWLLALNRWFLDHGVELWGADAGAAAPAGNPTGVEARAVVTLRDRPLLRQQVRDAVAA